MALIAIVRVRGKVKTNRDIEHTLNLLRLNKVNHCSVYKDSSQLRGMLYKAKDYITYGEINKETLKKLLLKRGRLEGNKRITKEWLKENKLTEDKLVELFEQDPKDVYKLKVKPVFRLTPPSKGFERKGIKTPYKLGGVLGDRKEKINDLLLKMI